MQKGCDGSESDNVSDTCDLMLVLARAATDNGNRTSFDDVLHAFGHTRESLTGLDDDDRADETAQDGYTPE